MARDRKIPCVPIKGLMLYAPQLDDRCETLSDQQYEYGNPTSTPWVRACWDLALPNIRGTDKVTPYHAPARAEDYSNMPPTYVTLVSARFCVIRQYNLRPICGVVDLPVSCTSGLERIMSSN